MEDQELIDRILSKDKQALVYFYHRFAPKLQRFIQRKVQNTHDGEEILQDTLFAFLESLRDFHGQAKLQTFLFSICQHKVIDYYRKKKLRHIVFSQAPHLEEFISPLLNPEEVLDAKLLKEKLTCTFSRILPQYRRVLQLKYWEDKSVAQIANDLTCTMKSIESLLTRARKAFVKEYQTMESL